MFKTIRKWFINLSTKIKMFFYPNVKGGEYSIFCKASPYEKSDMFIQNCQPSEMTDIYWDAKYMPYCDAHIISKFGFQIFIGKFINSRREECKIIDVLYLYFEYRDFGVDDDGYEINWHIISRNENKPEHVFTAFNEFVFLSTEQLLFECLSVLAVNHPVNIATHPDIKKGVYNILKRNSGVINEGIKNLICNQ